MGLDGVGSVVSGKAERGLEGGWWARVDGEEGRYLDRHGVGKPDTSFRPLPRRFFCAVRRWSVCLSVLRVLLQHRVRLWLLCLARSDVQPQLRYSHLILQSGRDIIPISLLSTLLVHPSAPPCSAPVIRPQHVRILASNPAPTNPTLQHERRSVIHEHALHLRLRGLEELAAEPRRRQRKGCEGWLRRHPLRWWAQGQRLPPSMATAAEALQNAKLLVHGETPNRIQAFRCTTAHAATLHCLYSCGRGTPPHHEQLQFT